MKVKTHVYMANLIIDELNENATGSKQASCLTIKFLKKPWENKTTLFTVPDEFISAILGYPDYFRAGSMGPDVFPDIYIGQSIIHPKDSFVWLEHLWNRRTNYINQEEITAFILGLAVHYAGDVFGHTYVNNYAGGPFPQSSEWGTSSAQKNITRHIAIESYIDSKIPSNYKGSQYNRIQIPKDFIQREMIYNDIINNGLNPIYKKVKSSPTHIDTLITLRNRLKKEADKKASFFPNPAKWAKQKYSEAWYKDIDRGLSAWIDTSLVVARNMLSDGNVEGIVGPINDWISNHLLSMIGTPDFFGSFIKFLGNIEKFIRGLLGSLYDPVQKLKDTIFGNFVKLAFGISIDELKKAMTNPTQFFTISEMKKIDQELGNFTTETCALKISFAPIYDSINLSKLILTSAEKNTKTKGSNFYQLSSFREIKGNSKIRKNINFDNYFIVSDIKPQFELSQFAPNVFDFQNPSDIIIPHPIPGFRWVLKNDEWVLIPSIELEHFSTPNQNNGIQNTDDSEQILPIRSGKKENVLQNISFTNSLDGDHQWRSNNWFINTNKDLFNTLFLMSK